MRLGIDASNIRTGGGLTHLSELLRAAEPERYGIKRIVVWAGQETLAQLPDRSWLVRAHEPALDASLPARLYWQAKKLPRLAAACCDFLFVPGGLRGSGFKPFVTMSHNLLPFELAESRRYGASWMFVKMLLLRWSQTGSFRQADGVIFLTEYARSVVSRLAGLDKLESHRPIIPHGINQRFNLPPRSQNPLAAYSMRDPFRFLYVSKVEPYKHQWNVVEAVARLRRAGLPVALDLIGGPECSRSARRLIKTILREDVIGEFVHYLDHIPYTELAAFYHRADAFVFASSCENLPNILLEAMAAGLPIACSRCGPMPEVLGPAGVYFDPEQPEEITASLQLLLDEPKLREECAHQAYQQAQQYSWERCARETFSFLADVAQTAWHRENRVALPQTALQSHN